MKALLVIGLILPPATTALIVFVLVGLLVVTWTGLGRRPAATPSARQLRWAKTAVLLVGLVGFLFLRFAPDRLAHDLSGLRAPRPRAAERVAADWKLTAFGTNRPVRTADLKDKVLLINFWATWCRPCVGEMPEFQKLYDRLKNEKQIEFLFVSLDQTPAPIDSYLHKTGITLPIYRPLDGIPDRLQPRQGIPTTFILGKDRTIRAEVLGPSWTLDEFTQLLRELAQAPNPDPNPKAETPPTEPAVTQATGR